MDGESFLACGSSVPYVRKSHWELISLDAVILRSLLHSLSNQQHVYSVVIQHPGDCVLPPLHNSSTKINNAEADLVSRLKIAGI